jgi:hypothetical protein
MGRKKSLWSLCVSNNCGQSNRGTGKCVQFHLIRQHSHDFTKEYGGFTGLNGFTET